MAGAAEAWLRLVHTPGLGPRAIGRLVETWGDPEAVLSAPMEAVAACAGLRAHPKLADREAISADLAWLERPEHHLVTVDDPRYPEALAALPDRAPVLFVCGDPDRLSRPQIAIVGSRKPSSSGTANAEAFAADLAAHGWTVTSGLALGIDGVAHGAALDAGGATVAVVATGMDRVYPARHRDLAHRVAAGGVLVSEFPVGTGVRREHFPRRNRLISGLSLGVLVVEAGIRSGSLVTARHAVEQGREVFAIPGSIHNPVARGCHWLIRQGAKLVETTDDILEELPDIGPAPAVPRSDAAEAHGSPEPELDSEHATLLEALGDHPQPLDVLLQRTGLTPDKLSSMLLLLELRGLVAACPGGRYARADR